MAPVLAKRLGADRSFERLYRKHAGDVYRYALVVLRNQADAEDVTQTTFLNAYRAMENGERPRSPQNWLIAIAHNVCRQRFRQSQRRPAEVVYEDELAQTVVEDEAISAEDIRRALGHLAFNQRSALVMRELEGRSYQEIAEILELSVSAVETLIFRARRALREQLEEGITCHEAELSISRQLDGRLPRKEKGALRAHLRECEEGCRLRPQPARHARRAQGARCDSAAVVARRTVRRRWRPGRRRRRRGQGGHARRPVPWSRPASATRASSRAAFHAPRRRVRRWQRRRTARSLQPHVAAAPSCFPSAQEPARDEKPFSRAAVKSRSKHRQRVVRAAAGVALAKPEHKEVSVLPPSRVRGHDLKPIHVRKPPHVKKPATREEAAARQWRPGRRAQHRRRDR